MRVSVSVSLAHYFTGDTAIFVHAQFDNNFEGDKTEYRELDELNMVSPVMIRQNTQN